MSVNSNKKSFRISIHLNYLILLVVFSALLPMLWFVECEQMVEDWEMDALAEDFVKWYKQTFSAGSLNMSLGKNKIKLDNLDFHNVDELIKQLNKFSQRLALVDTSSISFKRRVDYFLLRKKLNYLIFELTDWSRWQHDSAYYVEKLICIFNAPNYQSNVLSKSALERLLAYTKDLPGYLNHTQQNLQHRQINNIQFALEKIDLLKSILNEQVAKAAEIDSNFADKLAVMNMLTFDELDSFAVFLNREFNSARDSLPSLSRKQYDHLLTILLDEEIDLNALINYVESDYQRSIEEMANVARAYFNTPNSPDEYADDEKICQIMVDELFKDVPRKDQIIQECNEIDNYHKIFIDEIELYNLPVDYKINIEWGTSTSLAEKKLIELVPVDLSANVINFQLQLKPIPNDIEWIAQLNALRDYNRSHLKAAMLLNGFPIHYNFWFHHKKSIAPTAIHFPDDLYLSGFAFNIAQTLVDVGLGGYDLALQFALLEIYARTCFNALIELKYYNYQYNQSQSDSLFAEGGIFHQRSTEILEEIIIHPGQFVQAYWGMKKFKQLANRCVSIQGRKFRERNFYLMALKYGAIPLNMLEERLFHLFNKNK